MRKADWLLKWHKIMHIVTAFVTEWMHETYPCWEDKNHEVSIKNTSYFFSLPKFAQKTNLVPRVSHLNAWGERGEILVGLVTCLPESGRWQFIQWREGRLSKNFVYTETTGVRNVLSPKQTKFHVLRLLRLCPAIIVCKRRRKHIHRLS